MIWKTPGWSPLQFCWNQFRILLEKKYNSITSTGLKNKQKLDVNNLVFLTEKSCTTKSMWTIYKSISDGFNDDELSYCGFYKNIYSKVESLGRKPGPFRGLNHLNIIPMADSYSNRFLNFNYYHAENRITVVITKSWTNDRHIEPIAHKLGFCECNYLDVSSRLWNAWAHFTICRTCLIL